MLILVRHGRTALNARSLLQGRVDPPLDEVGLVQARLVADAVRASANVTRVISSPLQRARQTAEALTDWFEVDDRFVELDYGDYDGLAVSDVPADVWNEWRSNEHFAPPGGESLHELDRRVRAALDEVAHESSSGDVVVVSHVSPIKSAVVWALDGSTAMTWRCALDRASITRISVGLRGPSLVSFNETAHLNGTN